MENHIIFDLSVVVFIFLSAIFSFSRGFSQEILSLISWTSAFFISFIFSENLFFLTRFVVSNIFLSKVITYLLVFILSLFLFSYLTSKFSTSVKRSTVGMLDRSLGFLFGITRGYILLCLCFFIVNSFYMNKIPSWFDKSKMNYLLMYGSVKIISFFDKENQSASLLNDKIKKKSEKLFEKSIDSHLRREEKLNLIDKGYEKKDRDELEYLIENMNND